MSYDISLTHKDAPSYYVGNITYNVRRMYDKAFGGTEWTKCINNHLSGDVLDLISSAVNNMIRDPEEYKKLESDNKWGNYEQALEFLKEMEEDCRCYPRMLIYIT